MSDRLDERKQDLDHALGQQGDTVKTYIVCCGTTGRAVLVGQCETEPVAGQPVRLTNARMVLRWDAACGGLLGLAAHGPKADTRITAAVPTHGDECVRQWLECTREAAAAIEAWPCP